MKGDSMVSTIARTLPVDTIIHATLGKEDAIAVVMETFEPYVVEQSTMFKGTPREYIDEELAQALRATLLETIPKFRFLV